MIPWLEPRDHYHGDHGLYPYGRYDCAMAKIEQCALKLDKAGVYSSVLFQKNDWIFLCVGMSLFLQSRMELLWTGSTLKEEPSEFHAIQSSDA